MSESTIFALILATGIALGGAAYCSRDGYTIDQKRLCFAQTQQKECFK